MILDLINKERKENASKYDSKTDQILSIIAKVIGVGLFIALEVFVFLSLDKKIEHYSKYGTYDFLILFLFIMMFISIFLNVIKARKVYFKRFDNHILLTLPISSSEIIISKAFYIYLNVVVTNLIISTPLLIAYGCTRQFPPYFYIMTILYPFIISFFNVGMVLLLMVPYQFLYKIVKKYDWLQFVVASILMIGLCFIYQYALNLFLNVLSDSEIGGQFSPDFINNLHNARVYLGPVSTLLNALILKENIVSNICIFLGIILLFLVLGYFASSLSYSYFAKEEANFNFAKKKKSEKPYELARGFKGLLKKEKDLLFRDSSYIFSYTSLLIMQPLLSFMVIYSLSSIMYKNLEMFLIYYPNIIEGINITLILLFSSVINSSVSSSISRESKALQIIKYIPVDPFKQILAKLTIPTILSSGSLIITLIALISGGIISPNVFFVSLFIGLLLLVALNIIGIYIDMRDHSNKKSKIGFLNPLISIVVPLIIFGLQLLMSFYHINGSLMYGILIGIVVVVLLPVFIKIKSRLVGAFNKMEVK